jgi:hypothetical protein
MRRRGDPNYGFTRQHDVRVELTFIGQAHARSAREAGAHARAVLARRLLAARIKGDRDFVVQGFVSNGLVVAARTKESKRAEVAALRELALKYPNEAMSIVARVLKVKTDKK